MVTKKMEKKTIGGGYLPAPPKLLKGDCLQLMPELPENSIDLILCDLPYGLTDCKWDVALPLETLWKQYHRIIRPNGTAVLFGTEPFMSALIQSNKKEYSHQLYWQKNNKTGALLAKKQPLRCVEEIAVFILKRPSGSNEGMFLEAREYMFEELRKSGLKRKDVDTLLGNQMSSHYFTNGQQFELPNSKNYAKLQQTGFWRRPLAELQKTMTGKKEAPVQATYNPQGIYKLEKPNVKQERGKSGVYAGVKPKKYIQNTSGYPCNLIYFPTEAKRYHPTQKPLELIEYLIKTYSNPGDTVLDNCMGSGTTGVACRNTSRQFIGMELEEKYFQIAEKRIVP